MYFKMCSKNFLSFKNQCKSIIYLFKNKAYEVIKKTMKITCYFSSQRQLFVYICRQSLQICLFSVLYIYNFVYIHLNITYILFFRLPPPIYRSHISKHFDCWCLFMNVVVQVLGIIASNLYLFSQLSLLFGELLCSFQL